MIDGERATRDKLVLVLAADQRPFQYGGNRFCVLQPLMTLDGDTVETGPAAFPNRGRIWWMLRDGIRDESVVPGSLWTSTIENATKFNPAEADADKYQANRGEIQPDGNDLLEIIDIPVDDPDLSLVTRERRLRFQRKPAGRVFVRGTRTTLGPLKASWHAASSELELHPLTLSRPEVIRLPSTLVDDLLRPVTLSFTAGEFDPHASVTSFRILLSRQQWIDFDKLRAAGEVLDASLDKQVINWALKTCKITRATGQTVKTFFNEVVGSDLAVDEEDVAQKMARLRQLASESEAVLELGERVAEEIAGCGFFEDLVLSHVDQIAQRRVKEELQRRMHEIDSALATRRAELRAVETDVGRLTAEFESKARQQDEELQRRSATRLEQIEKREKAVASREVAIQEQEAQIHHRLERLINRYSQEAEKLADELLLQLPVLQRLGGFDAGLDRAMAVPGEARGGQLALPAYLEDPPFTAGASDPTEEGFLRQFERIVERRGFQFSPEDLRNFHTCLKVGGLTVLAGPSGTGKSSLPRLYAEALGWANRYEHISVRPDWLDDRDFVGAFNPLARRFEPSSSGVVDHLISALVDQERELGGIFILALDEMNLARVEHYFAQFLSVLELPARERQISLFALGVAEPSDPYHRFRELRIADNVRFVGTVNIDETTHFFSPKVLDRSQVVCLPSPELAGLQGSVTNEPIAGIVPVPFIRYQEWAGAESPGEEAKAFLLQVSEALQESRLGLRARQFQRILRYLACSSSYLPPDVALDYQLMQVVLPRLRRTAPRFEQSLAKLRALVKRERFPRTWELLQRMSEPTIENEFFQLI